MEVDSSCPKAQELVKEPEAEKMDEDKKEEKEWYKWKLVREDGERVLLTRKDPKGSTLFRHELKERWYRKYPEANGVKEKKYEIPVEEKKEDSPMEVEEKKQEKSEEKKVEEKEEWNPVTKGICDRCKEEVKFPPPACQYESCKKGNIEYTKNGIAICTNCKKVAPAYGAACKGCSYYVPAPNETFDAGRVNFTLPAAMTNKMSGIVLATTQHELPCPNQTNPDISKDQGINEFIFNHLPLKEEQKKELLLDLTKEQLIKDRDGKRKEEKQEQSRSTRRRRKEKSQSSERSTAPRASVKSSPFS